MGERRKVLLKHSFALAFEVVKGKLDETEYRTWLADMARLTDPPMDKIEIEDTIGSRIA